MRQQASFHAQPALAKFLYTPLDSQQCATHCTQIIFTHGLCKVVPRATDSLIQESKSLEFEWDIEMRNGLHNCYCDYHPPFFLYTIQKVLSHYLTYPFCLYILYLQNIHLGISIILCPPSCSSSGSSSTLIW